VTLQLIGINIQAGLLGGDSVEDDLGGRHLPQAHHHQFQQTDRRSGEPRLHRELDVLTDDDQHHETDQPDDSQHHPEDDVEITARPRWGLCKQSESVAKCVFRRHAGMLAARSYHHAVPG